MAKRQPRGLSPAGGQREARSSLCHAEPLQTHLGEEPPPRGGQLEVGGAVPLQDLHGRQLLPPLGEGPVGRGSWSGPPGGGRPTSLPTVLTSLPGLFPELRSSGVTSPRELCHQHPQPPPTQQMFQDVWRHFWLSQVGRALPPSGGEKPGLLLKPLRVPIWATKMWWCEGWKGFPDTGYLEERKYWEQRAEGVRSAAHSGQTS